MNARLEGAQPHGRSGDDVLVVGSGGREHALAWALRKSPGLTKLYCAPGNGGIAEIAECVPLAVADHTAVIRFCANHAIDFVVVGPEAPLVSGLVDDLTTAGIKCFGPRQAAARLEGSKGFTKDLCREFGIPTAAYGRYADLRPTVKVDSPLMPPGHGFGLGFAVRTHRGVAPFPGSLGQFFWSGMAGTFFFIDPAEDLFTVFMMQGPGQREYIRNLLRDLVYAAVE